MPPVDSPDVGAQQLFHAGHEVRLRRLHHQMKMIGHQAKGMRLPAGFPAGLAQREQQAPAILIVVEDRLAPVAAIQDACPAAVSAKVDDRSRQDTPLSVCAPRPAAYTNNHKLVNTILLLTDPFTNLHGTPWRATRDRAWARGLQEASNSVRCARLPAQRGTL